MRRVSFISRGPFGLQWISFHNEHNTIICYRQGPKLTWIHTGIPNNFTKTKKNSSQSVPHNFCKGTLHTSMYKKKDITIQYLHSPPFVFFPFSFAQTIVSCIQLFVYSFLHFYLKKFQIPPLSYQINNISSHQQQLPTSHNHTNSRAHFVSAFTVHTSTFSVSFCITEKPTKKKVTMTFFLTRYYF